MIAFWISERARNLQLFHMVSFRRGERLLTGFWRKKGKPNKQKKPQTDKRQTKQEQIPESCIATHVFTPADTIWVGVYKNQHNSLTLPPSFTHESNNQQSIKAWLLSSQAATKTKRERDDEAQQAKVIKPKWKKHEGKRSSWRGTGGGGGFYFCFPSLGFRNTTGSIHKGWTCRWREPVRGF